MDTNEQQIPQSIPPEEAITVPPAPKPRRSLIKRVFVSPDEPRLRAFWRLAIQFILMSMILLLLGLALGWASTQGINIPVPSIASGQLLSLVSITLSIFLARRLVDRRSFTSLGLKLDRHALWDLLAGIGIAGLMMALIYLLHFIMGWASFAGYAWETASLPNLAINFTGLILLFIIVGWQEELSSRGYLLQNLADGLNLPWGVMLSSFLFSLLHLANPNASWMSVLGILAAGLFLASGYITTRQLWLPIGLHIGWNLFEGPVFGFPVSGLTFPSLIITQVQGPEWITGGAFGPEAGLILLPGIALGVTLIYLYTRNRLK
ncbi:MAG: CPBP family intramembrane metalloprotease [Anaerolineales bacterium]|nr:CPBP family intramembrane metalloprotease [Anaerolineales bacterium]